MVYVTFAVWAVGPSYSLSYLQMKNPFSQTVRTRCSSSLVTPTNQAVTFRH